MPQINVILHNLMSSLMERVKAIVNRTLFRRLLVKKCNASITQDLKGMKHLQHLNLYLVQSQTLKLLKASRMKKSRIFMLMKNMVEVTSYKIKR